MYYMYSVGSNGRWVISACAEHDIVAHLNTTFDSCEDEDCEALAQLLHDEFGDASALCDHGGAMFDVVAVPDDVAIDAPAPGHIRIDWNEK